MMQGRWFKLLTKQFLACCNGMRHFLSILVFVGLFNVNSYTIHSMLPAKGLRFRSTPLSLFSRLPSSFDPSTAPTQLNNACNMHQQHHNVLKAYQPIQTLLMSVMSTVFAAPAFARSVAKNAIATASQVPSTWQARAFEWLHILKSFVLGKTSLEGIGANARFTRSLGGIIKLIGIFIPILICSIFWNFLVKMRVSARIAREYRRADEYQENMYFDVVSELLKSLREANNDYRKERITRKLNNLDPTGEIRDYIKKRGRRPVLKNIIGSLKKSSDGYKIKENKSKDELVKELELMLYDLRISLKFVMPDDRIARLISFLREKILSRPDKLSSLVYKLKSLLPDTQYWLNYEKTIKN